MKMKIKTATKQLFNKALDKCKELNIEPKVRLHTTKYLLIDNKAKDAAGCDSENTFDKFEGLEFDIDKFFILNIK